MTVSPRPMCFDVGDVIGKRASLAATYYPAPGGAGAALVSLPGGTYSHDLPQHAVEPPPGVATPA
jgi:hypothetical protein